MSGRVPSFTYDSISLRWYYHIKRKVEPKLHKNLTIWNQSYPFNQCCPMINGKRGITGCGPLAVATLMAYYRWPEKMGNSYYDWNAIVEDNDYYKISRLIEDLAAPEYLAATYGINMNTGEVLYNVRGIFQKDVVNRTFQAWQYDTSRAFNYAYFDKVKDNVFDFMSKGYQLASSSPIIMSGTNKEMGHIWVVDGFIERTKSHSNYLIPGIDPIEVDPLLHMVWGWGGNANGYYAYLRDSYQL